VPRYTYWTADTPASRAAFRILVSSDLERCCWRLRQCCLSDVILRAPRSRVLRPVTCALCAYVAGQPGGHALSWPHWPWWLGSDRPRRNGRDRSVSLPLVAAAGALGPCRNVLLASPCAKRAQFCGGPGRQVLRTSIANIFIKSPCWKWQILF